MILACQKVTKAFGETVIVRDGSFHIEDHEKAALVGINGAGKTTLLKMIVGELPLDGGSVILAKGKTLGYLAQHQEMERGSSIYEEIKTAKAHITALEQEIRSIELEMKHLDGEALESRMEAYHRLTTAFEQADGYSCESEITGVLKGLGFSQEDFSKSVDTLSGGQKTRVSLGKLLLTKPDVLLLDEPTNHLDLNSITWLENYLLNYPGAVVIVSHDRYFLNRIVSKVVEIENGELMTYLGNYHDYAAKKKLLREARLKEYLNQQQEIKHQEAVIEKLRSFNREKSIRRAESREKLLEKIKPVEKPLEVRQEIHLALEPARQSGNDVLIVEHLSKAFPPQTLFTDVNFEVRRGEHIAVIGDNGTGKTTLLKILNQVLPADGGSFRLGANVQIGYYDQEHHVLHMDKTIFDEISDDYPSLTGTQIRNMLAAFLFTGEDVFKLVGDLSGGERGRVSLAKLMLSEANFLILDEPTNHLDITSREILEKAFNDYTGTVLYVSHDRYFINQTATRILELVNQTFVNYIGNYDYYLEKKDELTAVYAGGGSGGSGRSNALPASGARGTSASSSSGVSGSPASRTSGISGSPVSGASGSPVSRASGASGSSVSGAPGASGSSASVSAAKLDWQEKKQEQAKKRKLQKELRKTEDRITALEARDGEIDALMTQEEVFTNSVKCQELAEEKARIAGELEKLYEVWETLV